MTEEIKIEKGVPFPAPQATRARYPFSRMDVGDSFVCNYTGKTTPTSAWRHYAKTGKKFTSRKISKDGDITTYRVWRIA